MPVELLLEVSSDVDELPTDVDAALEAEDVLSATAGSAARPKVRAAISGKVILRTVCMGVAIKVLESRKWEVVSSCLRRF